MSRPRKSPDREEPRVHVVEGKRFALAFLTIEAQPGRSLNEEGRALFDGAASALSTFNILPLQERVLGLTDAREELTALRAEAYGAADLDPERPFTFLQGRPVNREELAGLQLFGVIPVPGENVSVRTVPGGRLLETRDMRMLYAAGITGHPLEGVGPGRETDQAERMFRNARAVLRAQGFTFAHVVRTWIYLEEILRWHGAFNVVRNAFFHEEGIGTDPERSFPASTGIQGTLCGEACSMELLAVDGPAATRAPVHASRRQGRSFEYGSAFSRALEMNAAGAEVLLVSGTASIDRAGATKHKGQGEAQVLETLLCVAALLESRGAGLDHILQATLFCKEPGILRIYRQVTRLLGVPDFPVLPVRADICRPDLLVEMDAVAAVPARRGPDDGAKEP